MTLDIEYDGHQFVAIDRDTYDGTPDSPPEQRMIGRGVTREDAVDDLFDQLDAIFPYRRTDWSSVSRARIAFGQLDPC